MRILLFYDNLIRDYRGLYLLEMLLKRLGHKVLLLPLWDHAKETIQTFSPDTVLMGQIGEHSTAEIGRYCHQNGINLVINTTENMERKGNYDIYFRVDFKEFNDKIIDLQVISNRDFDRYVKDSPDIIHKQKYRFLGFPRLDISINHGLSAVELESVRKKYLPKDHGRVFLYISSFIFDEQGGQVDQENAGNMNAKKYLNYEKKQKAIHNRVISRLLTEVLDANDVLLVKPHPWDKSGYYYGRFPNPKCRVIDQTEYIVPIIAISDYVIHTQSSSAIEAWILNKKTISLLPDFRGNRDKILNHMRYEEIVCNFSQLKDCISHYPSPGPAVKSLRLFEPYLDGKSTIRLAHEILKLATKADKTVFKAGVKNKLSLFIKCYVPNLLFSTWIRYKLTRTNRHSYAYHLLLLELDKSRIREQYRSAFESYIINNENELFKN